jgi:FkbM family methyltransferase
MKQNMRPVSFNDEGWRSLIPISIYRAIHKTKFRGSTKLKNLLSLHPRDPEDWISRIVFCLVEQNTIFIDVGAQHGRHFKNLLTSKSHDNCMVIACEANHDLVCQLKINYQNFLDQRLFILHKAIADLTGKTLFHVNTLDSGYSGLKTRKIKNLQDHFQSYHVDVTTIDSLIKDQTKQVSVIKIDVEGAELHVLNGSSQCIQKFNPIVLFECANNGASFYGYNLIKLVEWFQAINYFVFTVNGIKVDESNASLIFDNAICHDFIACSFSQKQRICSVLKSVVIEGNNVRK